MTLHRSAVRPSRLQVALALLLAAPLTAQTVSLDAVSDTYLRSGSANKNQGDDSFLRLRASGNNRALVAFDPAAIAAAVAGGSLASASLELFIESNADNWGSDGRTVDVHRLAVAWSEDGATWNCPDDANPGNSRPDCAVEWAGGSFEEEPTDTVLHTNGLAGWVSFDVTEDVHAFLAGDPSHGWLVKKGNEGQNGRVDYSSRQGAAGQAPRLVLVVESPGFDEVPPALAVTEPARAVVIGDATPAIVVEYADGGSGVDLDSLQVAIDGVDVTASCVVGQTSAECEPPALAGGSHLVSAEVSDLAGNPSQASRSFELLLAPGMTSATVAVVADSYLRQGQPNQSQGSDTILRVRSSGRNRALLRVDPQEIAALTAGATVVSAHLELQVTKNGNNWGPDGRTVDLHPLAVPWTETGATWNCPDDADPGNQQPDCDPEWDGSSFDPTPVGTVLITKNLDGTIDFDVTEEVAAMAAGDAHDGWLLKKTDEGQSGLIEFGSREAGAEEAPRLVVGLELAGGGEDLEPPTVTILTPAEGSIVETSLVTVEGTVEDDGEIVLLTVDGFSIEPGVGPFAAEVALDEGPFQIQVFALDGAGRVGSAEVSGLVDSVAPTLTLSSPSDGQIFNSATVTVSGQAFDANGVAAVTVNGAQVPLVEDEFSDGVTFETEIAVAGGSQLITVVAQDVAGRPTERVREIFGFSLPAVDITAPADLSFIAATTVDVAGTVSADVAAVTVNGVAADLQGTSFLAEGVPLIEGGNVLTATATDDQSHVATATIHVVRDLTAPRVAIYRPADGATLYDGTVSVSGLINDVVPGTVNATEASVTVNGMPAQIANRSFLAEGVPLSPGDNELIATAVDAAGNLRQASVTVRYETAPAARIRIVSGDRQMGVIASPLPQPLVVELLGAAGQPVTGKPVVFKLRGNDGTLDGGRRQLAVMPDAAGRAQCYFTLGGRAGVANQVVEASAAGFAGPAVFTADAWPAEPSRIVVDSGGLQVGVAGRRVPRPLIAAVVDSGHNRLAGVPVVFEVVKGLGTFNDGTQSTVLATDSDGRAIVTFILDPEEGIANNVVAARLQDLEDGPVATFVASGRAAGDPVATSISGVVLDNTNEPIEGVTARVKNTALTAVTDAEGQFRIDAAPVGSVKLIIDGSTADQPGAWPDLEFDLVTIAGRDNTVNMPIFLLPLDLANGLYVDETEGGTLTLPQVPGFALDIEPGSVTFPSGGRSGLVSVTVVHNDRVPMVPNFGQQPRLIVTIQPAGARFEPPARMTIPNVEGLAPGEITEMYSFDHDLGHFVSIGPATVSDDGMVVRADPGVGIVKAGWHCGGSPSEVGAPHDCPECQICDGSTCVPGCLVSGAVAEPNQSRSQIGSTKAGCGGCDDGNACTVNDDCGPTGCAGEPKEILSVDIVADEIVEAGQPLNFFSAIVEAMHCPTSEQDYLWQFGDGVSSNEAAPSHGYTFPGEYEVTLKVSCRGCPKASDTDSMTVKVIDILVISADVTAGADGEIEVYLAPAGTTGTLTLDLNPGSHMVLLEDRPGGRHTEGFNIPGLAQGEYFHVNGTWEVEGVSSIDEIDHHMLVLGIWRHSQYNTPQDNGCGGAQIQSYITFNNAAGASPCFNNPPGNFQTVMLPQQFVDQVNLNGSGNVGGVGDVQVDVFCPTTAAAPAGAQGHTYRNQAIVPACGTHLDATTVAGCLNDARIGCDDQIFIHTVGTKTVTDNCPACCTNGQQFDNYTLNGACQGIGDLGNYMTIKLFP